MLARAPGPALPQLVIRPALQTLDQRRAQAAILATWLGKPSCGASLVQYRGRIEFIPVRPMQASRGLFKGMDTAFEREEAER